eukprot:2770312-Pleurochrysis_carterae.AAC.1
MKRLRDYNIEAYAKLVSRAPSASTAWPSARARMCRQAVSVRALAICERNAGAHAHACVCVRVLSCSHSYKRVRP